MKRSLVLLVLYLLSSSPAFAQEESIPDTLDWQLYYPLQIGNVWEYYNDNFPQTDMASYSRSEIVGDTTIENKTYFVVQGQGFDKDLNPTSQGNSFLRYDSTSQTVLQVHMGGCCPGESSFQGACHLGAPFPKADNSIDYSCPNGEGTLSLSGSYTDKYFHIGSDSIHIAAEKHFNFGGPGVTFYHGVGVPGGTSEGGYSTTSLIYLKVDGKEYGSSITATSIEETEPSIPQELTITSLYPNPFQDHISIEYSSPHAGVIRMGIFNVLGQRVWQDEMVSTGFDSRTVGITVNGWPPGLYVLRLISDSGNIETRTMVKIN